MCDKRISGEKNTNLKHHMKAAHVSILNGFLKEKSLIMLRYKLRKEHHLHALLSKLCTLKIAASKKQSLGSLPIFVGSFNVANSNVVKF